MHGLSEQDIGVAKELLKTIINESNLAVSAHAEVVLSLARDH